MPLKRRWGNKVVAALVRQLSGTKNLTDVACGFRAFTREVPLRLNLYGGFTYTQESLIDLISKTIHIHEVPMRIAPQRANGEGRISGNLFRYALLALLIIARAVRDQRPLRFFGAIGIASALLGIVQLGFVMVHWLNTGKTWPYTSLITGGAMCVILGVLLMVLALIADMMGRHRAISEKLLYLAKREQYRAPSIAHGGEGTASEQLTESTLC